MPRIQRAKRVKREAVQLVTMGQNDMVVKMVGGVGKEKERVIIRAVEQVEGIGKRALVSLCCDGLCCDGLKGSSRMEQVIHEMREGIPVIEQIRTMPK